MCTVHASRKYVLQKGFMRDAVCVFSELLVESVCPIQYLSILHFRLCRYNMLDQVSNILQLVYS